MDSAPTKPSDKAKEDLTIDITMAVVIPKITKILENSYLLENELENLIYIIF